MPTLDQHQSSDTLKCLLIGDSGEGKTGALASLAAVGYNIRIIDLDNGLDVLVNVLKKYKPEALKHVQYCTLTNKMKAVGAKVLPDGNPGAWSKAMAMLNRWEEGVKGQPGYVDLGPVTSWGKGDILVIDSLSLLSKMAMSAVLAVNGRLASAIEIQDYAEAMRLIEGLLALLYSDAIKCHVIMISHIAYLDIQDGIIKGFPNTIGQKLSPQVGRYFNNCFRVSRKGSGTAIKRYIQTVSSGNVELKNSAPFALGAEIAFDGIEGGLATVFQTLTGDPPSKWPKAAVSSTAT